ncbi:putative transporter [Wickerhamomyces ciferrii]|uniref:Transporter n=1 Tax=Wickerhamomyces ciferrii (strain ATCC 14091 / BCRC 22168 / CBS 111 / JCM 3599 / NBRC 0793 / NRRL Y-1031 F-60-10) TaxID=1206466 RepID=K0KP88_WICCF|nr:putative transporter [Wickerhamomyces ciferrii]CCH44007.1 putative transporter [Wickerhamomyces ciferrii]
MGVLSNLLNLNKDEKRPSSFNEQSSYDSNTGQIIKDSSRQKTNELNQDYESEITSEKQLDHIFKDPEIAKYYKEIYEKTNYECKDWFDPNYEWNLKDEKKLLWKLDWKVTFWAYFMLTALDFDRYNIQQALSDNMLDDLGLNTGDYNIGNTINLVCFLAAELPSQLISKKLGADVWIPMQLIIWSMVSIAQAGITNKAGFYVTRALIGAFQGGFICDTCLWMTYFYTSKELPFRLSLFYIANPLTSVFSSLLAFALLRIKTSLLPHGWQWLFIIEGVFTLLVGIISFFMMPPSAVQTKTWFRPNGWFTEHEEKIVVNRVLRDDPSKGDMNNRQPVSLKELFKSLIDYDILPIYLIRFLVDSGSAPVNNYMTLTLRKLGFNTFNTNLLTIPYNVLAIITMVFLSWFSEIIKSRSLLIATVPIWNLALLFPLRFWSGAQVQVWPTYIILTLLLGHAQIWPLSISWCSANSNSVRLRAVSSAVVNIFSQASGIMCANLYRPDDAPLYKRGNTDLIGIGFAGFIVCILTRYYYIWRNKSKALKWDKLTDEEKEIYIKETKDEGNKRLDFRFVY